MSTLPCWVKGRRGENSPRYHLFQMPEVQTTDSSLFAIYGERKCRTESETVLIQPLRMTTGRLSVIANADTPEQTFPLQEGVYIIGRKSNASTATIGIVTADKSMSREHIRIEVKKDAKGGYKHYLSDNNSKNHTLYNSNYLENGEIVVLNNNDEIIIGRTVLRFNE